MLLAAEAAVLRVKVPALRRVRTLLQRTLVPAWRSALLLLELLQLLALPPLSA